MLYWYLHLLGPVLRVQLSTLVFKKACRISFSALSKTSIGHVITLMANDAERFKEGFVPLHAVVTIPISLTVSFILSYNVIGLYSTLTAFGTVFLFIPLQFYMGKGIQTCRRKTAPHTDKRIKLIGETIASMKIIKMYKWESVFKNFIFQVRKMETKYIGVFMFIKTYLLAINKISPLVGLMALLITKYFTGEEVNSESVFFFLVMGELLRKNINWGLGGVFQYLPQFSHSLGRIQTFLLLEEQVGSDPLCIKNDTANEHENNGTAKEHGKNGTDPKDKETGMLIDGTKSKSQIITNPKLSLKISCMTSSWGGENRFILSDINMEIKDRDLVGIIGPVGSGKSSIVMSIIKEMDVESGTVDCPWTKGFYNQVPWIFNGSVKENILFNRRMDKEKFDRIIDCCYLTQDIEDLPHGIETIVGERGVQLSGGQRARVSLARVAYGDEIVVLLDDPLSAVDTKCANHIFNKLIKGELQNRTVVLVTHSTEFLSQLDYIYIMESAKKEGDEIVGRIAAHGTWEELHRKDLIKEQATLQEDAAKKDPKNNQTEKDKKEKPKQVKEDRKTGLIDKRTYFKFWNLSFGYLTFPTILLAVAAAQANAILEQKQALSWVEKVEASGEKEKDDFVVYIGLACLSIALYSIEVLFIGYAGIRSAKALHNLAFSGLIKTRIRFFDTTPIGVLINRFSKDTLFVDERLSNIFCQFLMMFTAFIASMVLLCISNYFFIPILIPFIVTMCFLLYFYLKTSVEVRRIEAILRSPVMSHVSATLMGMSTIRASRQTPIAINEYMRLQDRHTSALIMFKASERWLSVRLDCLVVLIGFLATLACIFLKDTVGPQLAGLGIVYIQNSLGQFQYCVRLMAEVENLMTAVERVFSLANLPPEEEPSSSQESDKVVSCESNEYVVLHNPRASNEGVIEFENVCLRYDQSLPFVLHGVNFKTKPCEKIGIVGRTGAGKSSIIQALYRMCEVQGRISINGVDTSTQTLAELRGSLSVIPQESLLFSGTLRDNLDPYQSYSDDKLWSTLEQVQLKSYVSGKGGLLTPIDEMGGNMSVGQRQLLCLARALLKQSSVLVVDEATANVDQETDAAIQETIRKFFSDRTVLTIAHRLNTIIDSDRIMVMDSGKLVEFDTPSNLLSNQGSLFYGLVHGNEQ